MVVGSDDSSSGTSSGDEHHAAMDTGLTQAEVAKPGPIVDEDGFELVQSRRRGARRQASQNNAPPTPQ